jgi:enoyl-CoA hydratase
VTTVVLDRPTARNAIDREHADHLAAAFQAFDLDDDALVAVLCAEGQDFCAGADLKAIAAGRGNRIEEDGDGPLGPTRMFLNKPVIAAIQGHAVAGGLELALWADLRVCEEGATFGVYCRRWGVPLIDGGAVRLARLIGQSRAMDLILTGRSVFADEALAIGLANRVVARGSARLEAELLALELASFPQAALRADRRTAYESWGMDEGEALRTEYRHGLTALEEAHAGARAYAQMREVDPEEPAATARKSS